MEQTDRPQPAPPLSHALPFWLSLVFVPMLALGAAYGGWWLLLVPVWGLVMMPIVFRID